MLHAWSTDASCTDDSQTSPVPLNLPPEYADFTNVFDKAKADTLPDHCPYDLKIEIEEGTKPPLAHLYLLSQRAQSTSQIPWWKPH